MQKKITLGLDANGVLLDPIAKVRALVSVSQKVIDPRRFGSKKQVMEENAMTHGDYKRAMNALHDKPELFAQFSQLMPGAEEFLHSMHDAGVNIVIVSSCRGLTERSLKKVLGTSAATINEFIVGENVTSKMEFYVQCDIVVEDTVDYLEQLLEHATIEPILMLPAPGGTGCDVITAPSNLHPRIKVSHGLGELQQHLSRLPLAA